MIIARVAWFLLASIAVATPTGDSLESPHISVVVSRRLHARGGDKQGSVSAKWNSNVELLSDIQIAGNNHSVVLDTGSADMWMFCTDGDAQMDSGRLPYNPSTGKKFNGSSFDINYGKGYAKGDIYSDQVTLAGITVDQTFGCAMNVSQDEINDRAIDGLIGLAFDSGSSLPHNGHDAQNLATQSPLNTVTIESGGFLGLIKSKLPNAQLTWTENAFPDLKEGFFTVDLKQAEDGVYNFGFIDDSRFTTKLTYMPVIHWNHWVVQTSGYQIGKHGQKRDGNRKALIDTGSTNIILDDTLAKEYFASVPKAVQNGDEWLVPCNQSDAQMPDLLFTFEPPKATGTTHFPAGPGGSSTASYAASVSGKYFIGNLSGNNDGMCQANINQAGEGTGWDIILGDTFLVSQLVVFDVGSDNGNTDKRNPTKGQIGFAPKPA